MSFSFFRCERTHERLSSTDPTPACFGTQGLFPAAERAAKKGIQTTGQEHPVRNLDQGNDEDENDSEFSIESTPRSVTILQGREASDARRRERKRQAREMLATYEKTM